MQSIDLLVIPGFFMTAVTVTVDVFATANLLYAQLTGNTSPSAPPALTYRLLTCDGQPVKASTGLSLGADGSWEEANAPVTLAFGVGMAPPELALCGTTSKEAIALLRLLMQRHTSGGLLGASCSSTFLLAETGLLNGGTATTSWWLGPTFSERYPEISVQADAMLTEHNRILCAGGALAQLDLALHLVGRLVDMELARAVARYLVFDERRSSQAPYLIVDHLARHDPVVAKAQNWIYERLATQIDIAVLAKHVGVSQRTLLRKFTQATGLSPARFVRRTRAETAAHLLRSTDRSITQITEDVGYADESALRRSFYAHFQVSPRDYRQGALQVIKHPNIQHHPSTPSHQN